MKKFTPEIISILKFLHIKKIDNLYNNDSLDLITNYKKSKKESKIDIDDIKNLIEQLPDGIISSKKELYNIVNNSIKTISVDSATISPLILKYKEFDPCKPMIYTQGNIITERDNEISIILTTLCRKDKRGVILTGAAGVGKTAIVRAINSKLIERNVPRSLIGCQMFNLDIPYIFAKYKDESISVIIKILEKASQYDKAILFIDEVHQLLSHRFNDILKPYLTEKIRIIGSTTIDEFYSIVSDDPALERRFTIVQIKEPDVQQTTKMLINTKSVYEEKHKCLISKDTCQYLVETCNRFLGHRKNPDKSLDILDIACSIMNNNEVKTIYDSIKEDTLEKNRLEIMSGKSTSGNRELTPHYVNEAISLVTGVDFNDIANSLTYKEVNQKLKSLIFGQDKAIDTISNIVNIFKYIKNDRKRPISILLCIGKSGVGKKYSFEELSKILFGSKSSFISYDMSGFDQAHQLSELRGAPPGYVGYGKSGSLIKQIRNNQLSVVYFRGINQAHPTISKYIIDGCRSGKLIDSTDKEASLNNCVIVFAITLSDDDYDKLIKKPKSMGFSTIKESEDIDIKNSLQSIVDKDIINICDNIIQFNVLEQDVLEKIYDNNVEYFNNYNVDIDKLKLKETVLKESKNGHDVISKLSSEVPKTVFNILKEKVNE